MNTMPSHEPDDPNQERTRIELATEEAVIRLRCPACRKKLRIRPIHAGEMVRCPKCKERVRVPGAPRGDATTDASVTLDDHVPRRPRDPRQVALLVTLDVALFVALGWLIGYAVWG